MQTRVDRHKDQGRRKPSDTPPYRSALPSTASTTVAATSRARSLLATLIGPGLVSIVACQGETHFADDAHSTDGIVGDPDTDDSVDTDADHDDPILDVGSNDSGTGGSMPVEDPTTCAEAAERRTYIGCEFWPTVTANTVVPFFDFAVVVANVGDSPADVEVERGGTVLETVSVPPNEQRTIYLPWVDDLKGAHGCMHPFPGTQPTVRVSDGAYRLVSSRPVAVYQFNPLQYRPQGGPAGKDWDAVCAYHCNPECYSYSNDASLLLPSTALTTNYRVTGYPNTQYNLTTKMAVTGTTDGTTVTVALSERAKVVEGPGVPHNDPGDVFSFALDRGEVVQLSADFMSGNDLSGTLIQSDELIQVIFASPCTDIQGPACDHLEETVFPAETWGKHYFVTVPTSPGGKPIGHQVLIYGNVDGTKLTYPGGKPPGFPDTINAGQALGVIGKEVVDQDFEIRGDHEFAVGTFQLSMAALGTYGETNAGDPSQSNVTAVEQFRNKYVFLAPLDYAESYVDIVQPMTAKVYLDGVLVGSPLTEIGASGFGVRRHALGEGNDGAHVLEADQPVGIQVMGYGLWTSYQYPGGLNLSTIAPPPPAP